MTAIKKTTKKASAKSPAPATPNVPSVPPAAKSTPATPFADAAPAVKTTGAGPQGISPAGKPKIAAANPPAEPTKTATAAPAAAPAPAKAAPPPAPEKSAAPTSAAPAVASAPAAYAEKPAPAAAELPPSQPAAPAQKPLVTTITAKIDVGFGNALYVRGEGPGLSWDQGLLMTCVADDEWQVVLGEAERPFILKFLVNDISWSSGIDHIVAAGQSVLFTPEF